MKKILDQVVKNIPEEDKGNPTIILLLELFEQQFEIILAYVNQRNSMLRHGGGEGWKYTTAGLLGTFESQLAGVVVELTQNLQEYFERTESFQHLESEFCEL